MNSRFTLVCGVAVLCLFASGAFAQSATVSNNPPGYKPGANSISQTASGGVRTQPQDGSGHDCSATYPCPSSSTPGSITPVNLDVTTLTGSAAATVLTAGHAAHGAWVTATVAFCINYNGTAGTTNNTPAGTSCGPDNAGWPSGQIISVPPTVTAVSVYGLTAGTAIGGGSQ